MAGLTEIPVVILNADDGKAAELALVENIQREDLSPVEEAEAYKALADRYSLSNEQISEKVGKSRPEIANKLRLLELPEDVLKMVSDGLLSYGHARALLGLEDVAATAYSVAKSVVQKGLSVRQTEQFVKDANRLKNVKTIPKPAVPKIDWHRELEKKLTRRLGRKTEIKRSRGVNRVLISFRDDDDLDTLIRQIAGNNIFDE